MIEDNNDNLPPGKVGAVPPARIKDQFHTASFWQGFVSPKQIWRSRISWRITITVFMTILIMRAIVLMVSMQDFKEQKLLELRNNTRVFLISSMSNTRDQLTSPITATAADRLFAETEITGLAVYGLDHNLIQIYGQQTVLQPSRNPMGAKNTYLSADDAQYEVLFSPRDIGRPYYVTARVFSRFWNNTFTNPLS